MKFLKHILLFALLSLAGKLAYGQIPMLANYVDDKPIHFGFLIGYNQMLFDIKMKENDPNREMVLAANSYYSPGFNVGIVSDLKLNRFVNIRLNPGLSFVERSVEFHTKNPEYPLLGKSYIKKAEAVYLDVPLEFKLRSMRWKNFRPYIIAGGKYNFDFASLKNVKPEDEETFLRINPHDVQIVGGFGFDFYLQYFKFAIELKMGFGTFDLLVEDNSVLTNSLDKMTARMFNFTLTFE